MNSCDFASRSFVPDKNMLLQS